MNRRRLSNILFPVIPMILACALIEWVIRTDVIPEHRLPRPLAVLDTLSHSPELWSATSQTGLAALVGFMLSITIGISSAVVLASARWIERMFYPYAVLFQTVPLLAIAPMLVIYIGYGTPTVIASSFIVSLFPVIANSVDGLRSTDPALVDLFKLYGARRIATLLKLRLPFALPQIFTGARIAAGLAVIGAIVGEFIAGGGLGSVIDASRTQQRVDKVFAALLLASGLGIGFFSVINLITWLSLRRWHASERDRG